MRKSYRDDNGEKIYRYSIRKYHFGAASVAVAALMFFANGVAAQEAPAVSPATASNVVAGPSGNSDGDPENSTEENSKQALPDRPEGKPAGELKAQGAKAEEANQGQELDKSKPAPVGQESPQGGEVKEQEQPTTADRKAAKLTQGTLKALLKNLTLDSMKALHDEVEARLAAAKAVLDDPNATQAQVDEQVRLMEDLISRVNKVLSEHSSKVKITPKEKLEKLSQSLNTYFKTASEITRPETKELLKGVEGIVRSVENGLKNPQLTASEIEELMKQGKQAEKKLALAVTREHSGKRDSDNGKRMSPDSYFRAATYDRAADGVVYDAKGNQNLREAEVGYITKEGDGSGYLPGTVLYISHNDNKNANGTNNKDLGRQPVKYLKNKVRAEVTKSGNGYHWKITYNEGKEPRQNPIYYFTVPAGQAVTNMKLIENGVVKKQGGVSQVFNGAGDKYLTAVGSPVDGVHGSSYYDNVANMNNGIVGNRGSIYSLDDFVKNSTDPYFNRDGMSQEDIRIMDKLFEKIKSSTQNVFAFKPKDFDFGNTYIVEFDTVGDTEAPLYYIAGMKSYEKAGKGRFMHKSYQQWNRVQERYNITVDTSRAKTTFLKGTGIGDFDDDTALRNGAVTLEDTYDNNRKIIPSGNDIRDYKTYKPVGNESYSDHAVKNRHNAYTYTDPHPEWRSTTEDSTKGNHTTYIEAVIKGQKINFRLPFRVVSQSDVYQPVAKTVQDTKSYSGTLGDAANYIERYDDVSSKIPNFRTPTADDMTSRLVYFGKFFKDRIEDFPTSSARIKEQAVKSVEWAGGTNDLTTGTRVIELTVDGKKELFKVPYDIDVVPGGKISAENVAKLNAAIREAYQKVDTNGNVSGTVPTVTSTTPVWVKKQIKVTYYDNENNARTNNQDDSVDSVDVLFKNIRKEATPTAPAISVPDDGSASVTPKGNTDKLVVSYRPTDQNADTTITVKKSGTTWGTLDTLPNGVTVNPSSGVVSITEPTVKDLSTITAKATYLNSDEASATDTVKTPDNVAPTVSFNGKALTANADDNRFIIYRGAKFNPTFRVQDNKNNVNLSITGLPKGVANVTASGSKDYEYTIPDNNVATDAPFGEGTATVVATDGRNSATYKFKYRVVELQTSNSPAAPEVGDSLGDAHRYLKVAESNTRDTDDYYPTGMRFIWKEVNPRTITVSEVSDDSKLNKIGKQTQYYAAAVFPNSGINDKNITINNESASYKIYSGPTVSKPVEFNVRPKKPTLAAEQFYGTAGTRPTVTVSNLPTNDQLQTGATVKVELYQGTTKIASKTVSSGTTSVNFENSDYNTNLTEGQQVHAVVKVTGGQGVTAYDVSSADSDNRIVTGRSSLNNLATEKLIVQVQDLNRNGVLSEAEKSAIKTAIFEANKNGVLKGKSAADINISATGLITAIDKDNKVAELQIDPKTGVVTRFAHIRDDYTISFPGGAEGKIRPTDPGFEWSPDGKSLIYKFDATAGSRDAIINTREILKKITATPKTNKAVGQPSLAVVTGNDKFYGENNQNNYSRDGSTGYFYHNNNGVNMLDIVGPSRYEGNVQVGNTANKLVEVGRGDINNGNIVGTTLGSDTISAENGAKAIPFNNVVKKVNGESLIVKQQLYLMPKYTNDQLLQDRGTTNADNTNVINVYFVPVDPTKPVVARSTSNTLATTSAQANRLADNTSFVSLAKLTDNYDKDDVTNSSSNTVRSKLNMWVKKGSTKVQIVENGVEKTDVINSLKKEVNSATYEVFAKTTDASGNKSHEDNSDGESLGFFRVGYNLVARQTINVVRGETLTQAELNKLVQVQEGNTLQDLPQGATVTATLDTNSIRNGKEETKSVEATINFGENRTQKINLTYKVLNTFPIARTIYDFKNPDTARQGGSSAYYHNGGTIPDGMTWIYKGNDKVTKPGDGFTAALANDPVGTTSYEFIGKYDYSRYTNRPTSTGNLEHSATLVHKVFDIADSAAVTVSKGATLTAEQAEAAVKKADDSDPLPEGTTYEWVESTDTNTPGKRTYKVRVTLPVSQSGSDAQPVATQARPSKTIDVTVKVKPTAPTIAPQTNGDVTITPANETNVNTLNFTYIHPNGSRQDITATKNGNTWSLSNNTPADGVTINENTGVVTIKDRAIKDNQTVTAKSVTAETTPADRVESDVTNGTSPNGDTERPKFVFQPDANSNTGEKVVEGGKQIVYVTPTESTDITIGNVTDNSGKLLEVRISDSNNRDFNLGLGSGVTNNEVIRANNKEHNAPRPVTITGTVSKLNGSARWNNGDVLTRYVQAQDAATNGIDTQGNSNQVTFKILTQAEKYTPTVGTQLLNKDVTAQGAKVTADEFTTIKNAITFTAERGTVKISNAANNRTTGLDIAMKDEGEIKHDNTGYYVEATVSYPDGTSEVVRVNVDKSDKEAPKVKLHGVELKENSAENPKFIVFRGAKFDPTFEVTDNANPITSLSATGLPTGTFSKTGSMTSGTRVQITENNIVPTGDTLTLGEHEGSVTVKDTSNNEKTYRFKYIVADVEVKNTPETVALGTKLVDTANSDNGKDAHRYVKAVIESNSEGNDKYYPTSMSFKWSKNDSIVSTTTTFNTPGIVKYKAVADFFNGGGTYTKTVEGVGNNIKIYAPNKIEREVTFKVQPTAPTISQWQNGNLKVTPTTDHDKVTIPLKDGSVILVKKATGWEVETPKEGVIVRGDSVEIPKELLGTTITAQGTKGTGDSAVDSENARPYTLLSHTVSKAEIIKKPTDTIATTDLSGTTGITGITDNNVNKTYSNAGITSVGFTNGTPTLTPDSEQNVPVTITYNDGSKETVDVTLKVAPAAPNVTVNKQDEKTGDVTLTIKRHDNSNYPNDSVVTVPGIDGTFKVKDGTITIKNDQLKDKVQTGKVTVTETGKLPAETDGDKVIPAKMVASEAPTLTKQGEQDPTTGAVTYKVTKPGGGEYPQNSKVTLNGHDYTVGTGGLITVPNDHLPDSKGNHVPTATETGKLPTDGTAVEVPAKMVASEAPTLTKQGEQNLATPSDDTNRRPDTSTPDEVPATQPAEEPSQTVEVPTQLPNEVSETNPSVSQPQAVLPNTGTQEDRATGALGVLSLLGAFGLLFAKKKKDDEEEA